MKVELEDVMFWMDAIRNSEDRYRTLESFWKGQLRSKIWLVEALKQHYAGQDTILRIVIHGGWNGVLASLIYNSGLGIKHITSVDIDHSCEETARTINKRHEMRGTFTAVTADMCDYKYEADVVINTSCEHITQEQYKKWLDLVPDDALIVLQSNNYYELDEHINCVDSVEELADKSFLNVGYKETLVLPKYNRFMVIGKKNV